MGKARASNPALTATIIGGTGGMGRLVEHTLRKYDWTVHTTRRDFKNLASYTEESDIIFISVPHDAFARVVVELELIGVQDKLLVDLSSGVSAHLKALATIAARTAFMHLMFGPDIYTMRGQNVVLSADIDDSRFGALTTLFHNEGVRITEATPEHHDYLMGIVQALSQFNTIAIAKTISELKTTPKELSHFASLTFSLQSDLIARIVAQPAGLWSTIQFTNPHFDSILTKHMATIETLASCARMRDYKKFEKVFQKVVDFWNTKDVVISAPHTITHAALRKNAIAILGPKGSYSEEALQKLNSKQKPLLLDSIPEVLEAVARGRVEHALVPFENSIHGTVLETLDGIYQHRLRVLDEIIVPVEHVLAGKQSADAPRAVRAIYSHPQALAQCARYLRAHYPSAKLIATPSTSSACEKVSTEGQVDALAIGSKLAATLYGLSILDAQIQDVENNKTQFVLVAKKPSKQSRPFTLLVVRPTRNRPGILHDILGVFKRQKVNLLKLESRPSREQLGEYIFYIITELGSDDSRRPQMLIELRKFGTITELT
jgi:prephenate dehydratase